MATGAGARYDGFAAFFRDVYPRVVGQLRVLTGDLASAEDVAQEAFVRAASRWAQLARYEQPEAWVRKTAFRCGRRWCCTTASTCRSRRSRRRPA